MPGLKFSSGAPTPVAIQTSARTMLAVFAASGKPITVKTLEIAFNGSAAAAGIFCELTMLSADGTGTTVTPRSFDQIRAATPGATAKYNYTVEPTVSWAFWNTYIPPSAKDRWVHPFDDEFIIPASSGIGVRITGAASNTPNAAVTITAEE